MLQQNAYNRTIILKNMFELERLLCLLSDFSKQMAKLI